MHRLADLKAAIHRPGKLIWPVSLAIIIIIALLGFNHLKLSHALGAMATHTGEFSSMLKEAAPARLTASILEYEKAMSEHQAKVRGFQSLYLVVFVLACILMLAVAVVFLGDLGRSVNRLSNTLALARDGDLESRSLLGGSDALAGIGQSLDEFLDQRVAVERRSSRENRELSNAVINLLHGVHDLSKKDLTARVEVTEDATGPIADSINLLADEIANVLQGVVEISDKVSHTCRSVKDQADTVVSLSSDELLQVDSANAELLAASRAMVDIAALAQTCNAAADEAIQTTSTAKDTVEGTVDEITKIRETIRETEKRIKRLGERSQEINSVVGLINSIAERTHILALNASMHAASAGEAGRGFAVVADEVQRLAENAREATAQISSLVGNIQAETADAVTTMNEVITEVVSGTQLAEQAGIQMQETMMQANRLVAMIQQIAESSSEQAKTTNTITERARAIKETTQQTNRELHEQSHNADKLVQYSSHLVEAVGVFTLPDSAAPMTTDERHAANKPSVRAV